jgi:O-antigen ligase
MLNAEAKVRGVITQKASARVAETISDLSRRERLSLFLSRAIFVAVLAVIALTAIPYGTVDPWWEALFQCIMFALGALWIIEGWLGGKWFVSEHRLLIPLIALIAFAFFQTLPLWNLTTSTSTDVKAWRTISVDPYGTRLAAVKLLAITLTGGLLLRYTSSQRRLRILIYTLIGIGIASALFGIIRQTVQREPGFILPYLMYYSGYAQFLNRNHLAFLMEMTLGLVLGLVFGRGVSRDRIPVYLAMSMPLWTALVLSNSRGGVVSLLCQVIFVAIILFVRHPRGDLRETEGIRATILRLSNSILVRSTLVIALILVMGFGILWMGGDPLAKRLETVPGEVVSVESEEGIKEGRRLQIWRATWQMIKANPIVGVGLGGFWVIITEYDGGVLGGRARPYAAHNDYLELVASVGLIGLAICLWFVWGFIKRVRVPLRSRDNFRRAACLGALIGIFGVAVHSIFDFGLHITINALIFSALIVIAVAGIPAEARGTESSKT